MGDRDALLERIGEVLDRNWLTNDGPLVQELELRIADRLEVEHCVLVANGTLALELAVRALELKGEVILPSFTFIATAHALAWNGVKPVFCDIDPVSLCIDPDAIPALINEKTTGIVGVHLYGRACDTERLEQIAGSHGLRLFFDAAHGFACSHGGRPLGAFGDCEVFSFHATKVLNTLEGGAITTSNPELARQLRQLRNFGFPGDGREVTVDCGTNAKLNEFCAAVGLNNLASLDQFVEANRAAYRAYQEALSGIPGVTLIQYDEREACNYQYVIAMIDSDLFGANRDELLAGLSGLGILARKYFAPGCHAMAPYDRDAEVPARLPVTTRVARQVLALPTGPQVTKADIEFIARYLREFPATREQAAVGAR